MKRLLVLVFMVACVSVAQAQFGGSNARNIRSGSAVPNGTTQPCVPGPPWTGVYIRTTDHSEYQCTAVNTWTKVTSGTPATSTSPGGSDTQVQFNDSSAFGGDAGFTYNKTTDRGTIGSIIIGAGSAITSSGAGGALGTNAFTSTAYMPLAGGTFSGDVTHSSAAIILSGNISGSGIFSTSGIRLKGVAATFNDTTSSGTVTAAYTDALGGNTLTATGATTITDYFTVNVAPPTASTNVTLTRKHSLGILDSTSASSSITGGLVVATAYGTTATSVGIGGGNINAGGTVTAAGVTSAGSITTGAGSVLSLGSSRASLYSGADNNITLAGSTIANFSLLHFAGDTSSFPALKRSGTTLAHRLADDSADAPMSASNGTFSGNIIKSTATLVDGSPGLSFTATMPTTIAATNSAVLFSVTSAGSSAQINAAVKTDYNAGYAGGSYTIAQYANNLAAGTGTSFTAGGVANYGVYATAQASTAGANVAILGSGTGSTSTNVGLNGVANFNHATAADVGVLGTAINASGGPQVGGAFVLTSSNPTFTSTALLADNGAVAASIFLARDNGTGVFTIGDGGTVTLSTNITNAAGTPGSLCYNTATFEMVKNNALTCTVSAREFKLGIQPIGQGLDLLMQMRPSQFAYRDNPGRLRWGFIADELQAVDRRLGDGYNDKGEAKSIDIPAILSINTKSLQELYVIVAAQQKEIEALKAKQ